ncbi:hypothetical protein [Methylobacterium sp. CCH5-D2]|uniref:hypothetical protein n=1 Tax=Methylobacterium sp. CCH5-D2 TaxID=1768765 RepID=UPI0008308449|nr:hypothetical protein [Methylobacterium sp. CCH5-D2]
MAAIVLPSPRPAHPAHLHRELANAHAVIRGSQRGPRPVGFVDLQIHEDAIRSGESTRVYRNSTSELHAIEDMGDVFYAVWSLGLRSIVTYLARPQDFRVRPGVRFGRA